MTSPDEENVNGDQFMKSSALLKTLVIVLNLFVLSSCGDNKQPPGAGNPPPAGPPPNTHKAQLDHLLANLPFEDFEVASYPAKVNAHTGAGHFGVDGADIPQGYFETATGV